MLPVIVLLLIVALGPVWAEDETDTDHKTNILDLTFLPSGPLPVGTAVAAIVRVYTTYGALNPLRWTVNGVVKKVLYEDFKALEKENEYEISSWLGKMDYPASITLQINNMHGSDRKTAQILAGAKFGEKCSSTTVCVTNNTECTWAELCMCRTGYYWDSSENKCSHTGMFGSDCDKSEHCRQVTNNSECNPVKGKCFCMPGYGYEDRFAGNCNRFPFYKVIRFNFGMRAVLNCTAHLSNVTEIQWFRNGRDLCTSQTPWCSQGNTTSREKENNYFSQLVVRSVTRNDNYTCVAFNSDGKNWTVSNQKIVVESQMTTDRPSNGTSTDTTSNGTLSTSEVTTSIGTSMPPNGTLSPSEVTPSIRTSTPPTGAPVPQGGNVLIKNSNIFNLFVFPLQRQK